MQTQKEAIKLESPIIFYDGVCGICNKFVQRVIRADKEAVYRFAPIQGETAEQYLGKPEGSPEAWTIIMIDEQGRHNASTAILRILRRIHWGFGLPALGFIFPRGVRDWVYSIVARYRYRVFGKLDSCPIPTPATRARMLP